VKAINTMNAMGAVKVAEAVLWQMLAFLAFFGIFAKILGGTKNNHVV
jgi:hypothetical protein